MALNLRTLDALVLPKFEEYDPEVWGFFVQGEPKEFHSTPPTGVIKPTAIRSVPPFSWDYDGSYIPGVAASKLNSAFCPVTADTWHGAGEVSSAGTDVKKLLKSMKMTERQLKFQLLQRAQMYEREDELSQDRMVLVAELRDMTEYAEILEQKNRDLNTHLRRVTEENKSLSSHVDRLVRNIKMVVAGELRQQRGEGEGPGGLAQRVQVNEETGIDQQESWTDLSPYDSDVNVNESTHEDIDGRFHSPTRHGVSSEVRLINEDTPPLVSSKRRTKKSQIPKSLFGRLRGAFGRIRGQI
ncbi:uncharacterized protein LOC124112753 [Haliotis rufescens]|uniref:uncharacterized protein LOC124112753 n=1 Tax=Haliotis rufescens TaxID=6454 RepID=UPI00201E7A01|nr:uncharacterized protein LOC124112753 [Haliotis rufescens]